MIDSINNAYIDDLVVPNGFNRVVPVAFAMNDQYSPYAGVAIQSILNHATEEDFYRFYVLYSSLSDSHIRKLKSMSCKQGTVTCVCVAELAEEKNVCFYERAYFTQEMYYRFLIPELFPFYETVIYLDCDLVVTSNLAELLLVDLGNNLLAGVDAPSVKESTERLRKDIDVQSVHYINSGVLVMNVQQWNRERVAEKCLKILAEIPHDKLLYPDQDILNIVCEGRILLLEPHWNFCWHMMYGSPEMIERTREIRERVGDNFKILHFSSSTKPWSRPELPYSCYFWDVAKDTPFIDEIIDGTKKTLSENQTELFKLRRNKNELSSKIKQQEECLLQAKRREIALSIQIKEKTEENIHLKKVLSESKQENVRLTSVLSECEKENAQLKKQLAENRKENVQLGKKVSALRYELSEVYNSKSFRLGRVLTWYPRKIRDTIRCYRECGLQQTVKRIFEKASDNFSVGKKK